MEANKKAALSQSGEKEKGGPAASQTSAAPSDRNEKKLFKALAASKLAAVIKYASKKDKEAVSSEYKSRLLFTALDKSKEIFQALLDHGASANAQGVDTWSLDPRASAQPVEGPILHAVLRRKRIELLTLLLGAGANAAAKDAQGFSALHYAAQLGLKDAAVALIRAGADVNSLTLENWTPLHAAAHAGSSELVRLLLEHGADPLRKTSTGQLASSVTSSSIILGLLPSSTASSTAGAPAKSGSPLLPRAAPETKSSTSSSSTPSRPAFDSGKSLATHESASAVPQRALPAASGLRQSSEENATDMPVSSLWVAASAGNAVAVAEALKHGTVDVNLFHLDGSTPLWISCFRGHAEVVRLLLGHKEIDVELRHKKLATTPLFAACASGHTSIAKALLEKGAQVHTEDKQGDTVLHVAAMNGNLEIVQLMLANTNFILSVAVNEQNDEGATSLFLASANGHVAVVEALLTAAASADIRNMSGLNPLDVAIKNNHPAVWKVLVAHLKDLIAKERADMETEQRALTDLLERARPLQSETPVQVDIKCMFNNKIRSTSILNTASVADIVAAARSLFEIPATKTIDLKYTDADKDKLNLTDLDDLRDFFMFCPSKTLEISAW